MRKFVVPKEGVTVLDDLNRVIPAKGAWLNFTTLISRVVKDGDLKVVKHNPSEELVEIKEQQEIQSKFSKGLDAKTNANKKAEAKKE